MQNWQREDKKIYRDGSIAVIHGGMRASVRPHSAAAACCINCIRARQSVRAAWCGVGRRQLYFCQRRAQRVHSSWLSAARHRQYRSRWQCYSVPLFTVDWCDALQCVSHRQGSSLGLQGDSSSCATSRTDHDDRGRVVAPPVRRERHSISAQASRCGSRGRQSARSQIISAAPRLSWNAKHATHMKTHRKRAFPFLCALLTFA